MPRAIHIERNPNGPRLYLAGQRVHHGATGVLLAVAGRRHRALLAAGLVLCGHDHRDWRIWFRRETTLDRRSASL